jgi:hypothetical protein
MPDIRAALDTHAKFILLAQPGAGKTTVLQRIALDKALGCWQGKQGAQLPLFVRLAAQQTDETPQAFLARMWQEAMPGGAVDGMSELRDALRRGRLCLLVDAINEARREHYTERMHDWRDFAAELPAGNHLVFSCRTLDYAGELAVQQVEIDPLTPAQVSRSSPCAIWTQRGVQRSGRHCKRATATCASWRRRPTTCTCWSRSMRRSAICPPTARGSLSSLSCSCFSVRNTSAMPKRGLTRRRSIWP